MSHLRHRTIATRNSLIPRFVDSSPLATTATGVSNFAKYVATTVCSPRKSGLDHSKYGMEYFWHPFPPFNSLWQTKELHYNISGVVWWACSLVVELCRDDDNMAANGNQRVKYRNLIAKSPKWADFSSDCDCVRCPCAADATAAGAL